MARGKLVGFVGSTSNPSKSRALASEFARRAEQRYGLAPTVYDINDFGPSLGNARQPSDLDERARAIVDEIVSADVLVVGTPTYKGSYTGLFKHLVDLLDPLSLQGKPIVLTATGGGDRHALIVEHQLRPLFGFFAAHTLPTAVYAADRDFEGYAVRSEALSARIDQAVLELKPLITIARDPLALAAA